MARTTVIKENETKNEKFERLALYRMNKLLTTIEQIENLASSQYESTPEQVEKMEKIVYEKWENCVNKLRNKKSGKKAAFTF